MNLPVIWCPSIRLHTQYSNTLYFLVKTNRNQIFKTLLKFDNPQHLLAISYPNTCGNSFESERDSFLLATLSRLNQHSFLTNPIPSNPLTTNNPQNWPVGEGGGVTSSYRLFTHITSKRHLGPMLSAYHSQFFIPPTHEPASKTLPLNFLFHK